MIQIGKVEDYDTPELRETAKEYAKVFFKSKRNRRPFDVVYEHTFYGEIAERAFADYFGYKEEPFDNPYWDVTDPKTGTRYEVKHTRYNSKWWNFGENYDFFLTNSQHIDKIVLIVIPEDNNIYLKWIANAKTFPNYVSESNYNAMGYYYNVIKAAKDGQCIEVF